MLMGQNKLGLGDYGTAKRVGDVYSGIPHNVSQIPLST